jgi:hypothetical protein
MRIFSIDTNRGFLIASGYPDLIVFKTPEDQERFFSILDAYFISPMPKALPLA